MKDIACVSAKFRPNATQEIVHHMFLFVCSDVSDEEVWNCVGMDNICKYSKQSIIYGWAKNGPELILPKGFNFKIMFFNW